MKRFLLALASLALLSVTLTPSADAGTVFPGRPQFDPVKWRNPVAWSVDSVKANIGAARCTSAVYPTSSIVSTHTGNGVGQVSAVARVWFYTSSSITHSAIDTLYYAVDGSLDQTTWYQLVNDGSYLVMGAAGDGVISAWLNTSGAAGNGPSSFTAGIGAFPFIRFVVSAGNNSGGFPEAQILVAHDSADPPLVGNEIAYGKWEVEPLKWTSNSIDSLITYRSQNGTSWATSITTKAVSTSDCDMSMMGVNTGVHNPFAVVIEQEYAAAAANCDSVIYAVETSADGVNFTTNATYVGQGSPIDADGGTTKFAHRIPVSGIGNATTTSVRLAPFWRLKMRWDDSDGIAFSAKAFLWKKPVSK